MQLKIVLLVKSHEVGHMAENKVRIGMQITPEHAQRLDELKKTWRFNLTRSVEECIDIAYEVSRAKAQKDGERRVVG